MKLLISKSLFLDYFAGVYNTLLTLSFRPRKKYKVPTVSRLVVGIL